VYNKYLLQTTDEISVGNIKELKKIKTGTFFEAQNALNDQRRVSFHK
jgi:hypothetical protein